MHLLHAEGTVVAFIEWPKRVLSNEGQCITGAPQRAFEARDSIADLTHQRVQVAPLRRAWELLQHRRSPLRSVDHERAHRLRPQIWILRPYLCGHSRRQCRSRARVARSNE